MRGEGDALTVSEHDLLDAICREDFGSFAAKAFEISEPGTEYEHNWHIDCIAQHLMACYRGEIKRLIINVPPRTLKSYLVARAFPAWVMGKNPHSKFICTSYGEPVAEQNSLVCRNLVNSEWYQRLFKDTRIGDLDRNTHWTTDKGGQYYAASALSPITGIGCRFMIIDDPIKPMEASSDQIRKTTNENIRATLFNRFDDKRVGCVILIMQRVHDDDPTGNLLDDSWVHIKLPAQATHPIKISLGSKTWEMRPGDLLFPSRLSSPILEQTRIDMTEYHYVGQYLQEPAPIGGGEFKEQWPQYYQEGGLKPHQMNVVIIMDSAGGEDLNKKKKKLSDYTAMEVIGLGQDNNYYRLDAIRDRLNPTERIDTLFMLHRKWNALCGKPPKVGIEQYGLMTDAHYIKEKQKEDSYHFAVVELGGRTSKEERIRRLIPDLQRGRWFFPPTLFYVDGQGRKFDLQKELIDSEMATFPRSRYDDMLDALSRVYDDTLFMTFPKAALSVVAKARRMGHNTESQDWMEF